MDWTNVSDEMAKTILKQGELFLQAQLQAGIAADQRAARTGGIFTTLGTGVLAATLAYGASPDPSVAVYNAGVTVFAMMIFSALMALLSARPTKFFFAGNHPKQWFDVAKNSSLAAEIMGEAENYQARIEANAAVLRWNGRLLMASNLIAVLAPVGGYVVWHYAGRAG